MAADVVMPQMGESIFEGTITKWLKKPGDKVERDEPLFEISTDKVDAEIPSPSAGVLKEIKIKEGQTVPINTVVATIDAAGSVASAAAPAAAPPGKAEAPKAAPAPAPQPAASKPGPVPVPSAPAQTAAAAAAPAKEGARIHSSPLVRRLAKEHGILKPPSPVAPPPSQRTRRRHRRPRRRAPLSSRRRLPHTLPCRVRLPRPRTARNTFRHCSLAYPASACTSATTKSSLFRPCASRSPSTWSLPSTFRPTCTRSMRLT